MDTDFEDECKEIHRRRLETSDKLKKLDKDQGERDNQKHITKSPSKLQDIMAIVSTACEVRSNKFSIFATAGAKEVAIFKVCLHELYRSFFHAPDAQTLKH